MLETKIESICLKSSYKARPLATYIVTCPQVEPHAILQITHGMAEYWLRYRPFAEFMARNGYVVCGNDDLGHGATSGTDYPDGFFSPRKGRHYVLQDLHQVTEYVQARYPQLPLVLFGHSMGSFFARWAAETWPEAQDAAIFCGTGGRNPAAPLGVVLTSVLCAVRGPRHVSRLVDHMAFGTYQQRIPDAKTDFDWLSVNEQNVADYIKDPKCGFLFTVSAFREMMLLIQHVNGGGWVHNIKKCLPVLLVAGAQDPVGNYGAGPQEVAQRLRAVGVQEVAVQLYPGMRHEILNETGKEAVWNDLLAWCDDTLAKAAAGSQTVSATV